MLILVETYRNPGEPSHARVRVRALPNQIMDGENISGLKVRCSIAMRTAWPIGQHFWLDVVLTRREEGALFLHATPRALWRPA